MDVATSLRLLVNGGESERVKDETGVGVEGTRVRRDTECVRETESAKP